MKEDKKKRNITPFLLWVNIVLTITVGVFLIRGIINIENNQYHNSTAIETFVRVGLVCTATHPLPITPTPTIVQINTEGNECFPNTPIIK